MIYQQQGRLFWSYFRNFQSKGFVVNDRCGHLDILEYAKQNALSIGQACNACQAYVVIISGKSLVRMILAQHIKERLRTFELARVFFSRVKSLTLMGIIRRNTEQIDGKYDEGKRKNECLAAICKFSAEASVWTPSAAVISQD